MSYPTVLFHLICFLLFLSSSVLHFLRPYCFVTYFLTLSRSSSISVFSPASFPTFFFLLSSAFSFCASFIRFFISFVSFFFPNFLLLSFFFSPSYFPLSPSSFLFLSFTHHFLSCLFCSFLFLAYFLPVFFPIPRPCFFLPFLPSFLTSLYPIYVPSTALFIYVYLFGASLIFTHSLFPFTSYIIPAHPPRSSI